MAKLFGCDDLAVAWRFARQYQFVTGGENGDDRAPVDRQDRVVHGRCQSQMAVGQFGSALQKDVILFEILTAIADIGAFRHGFQNRDECAVALGFLLHDDRVGPFGHRRTGEDAHRFPIMQRVGEEVACGGFSDDLQLGWQLSDICRP